MKRWQIHRAGGLCVGIGSVLVLCSLAFATQQQAKKGEAKLKVGDAFPDVALEGVNVKEALGKDQKTLKVSELKGKNVVVYFFPKAMTPG